MMKRRDFTAGVITGIALTGGVFILVNKYGSEATRPTEILRQIAERTLGLSGFQLSGDERESTLGELEAMLVESVSSEPDAFLSASTLQAALEKIMLEEIQAGKVDSINGVIMSHTEANLVRYASLLVGDLPQAAGTIMQSDVATNPSLVRVRPLWVKFSTSKQMATVGFGSSPRPLSLKQPRSRSPEK